MTTNRPPYQLHLLTLRVWQEVLDGEKWEWRGEVKNTSTGEVRFFRDFHVLKDLLPILLVDPSDEFSESQGSGEAINTQKENDMAPRHLE